MGGVHIFILKEKKINLRDVDDLSSFPLKSLKIFLRVIEEGFLIYAKNTLTPACEGKGREGKFCFYFREPVCFSYPVEHILFTVRNVKSTPCFYPMKDIFIFHRGRFFVHQHSYLTRILFPGC